MNMNDRLTEKDHGFHPAGERKLIRRVVFGAVAGLAAFGLLAYLKPAKAHHDGTCFTKAQAIEEQLEGIAGAGLDIGKITIEAIDEQQAKAILRSLDIEGQNVDDTKSAVLLGHPDAKAVLFLGFSEAGCYVGGVVIPVTAKTPI